MGKLSAVRHMVANHIRCDPRFLVRHDFSLKDMTEILELLKERQFTKPKDLAKKLGICVSTVYRWIDEGKLEAYKILTLVRIPLDQKIPVRFDQ